MNPRRHSILLAVFLACLPCPLLNAAEKAVADGVPVLGAGGLWRKCYVFFPPKVTEAAARELKIDPKNTAARQAAITWRQLRGSAYSTPLCRGLDTPPPPSNWRDIDFDDSTWLGGPGPDCIGGASYGEPGPVARGKNPFVPEIGFIARRGKFIIKDRSKVKALTLSVTYRGGFVAYLNGTEVARGSMPQRKLECRTPSSVDYPLAAFLAKNTDGTLGKKPLHHYGHRHKQYWPQWSARERRAGPFQIKPGLLRDGLNVLAVQFHRTDYPAVCTWKTVGLCFATLGLCELSLRAETPADNIVSSIRRPAGFRVWNADAWGAVADTSYGDPTEPLRPIRIEAARNGVFSGQVIVASDQAIENLRAEPSALRGPGEIPAQSVQVRFVLKNPCWGGGYFSRANVVGGTRFDVLVDRAPAKVEPVSPKVFDARFYIRRTQPTFCKELGLPGVPRLEAVIPVWLDVRVPRDAKPGLYKGTLTIGARNVTPVTVPIELTVADWTLPDAKDRTSILFIYQSPDTLAEYYKVPRWSEKHWALIEGSLRLMGEAGSIGLHFPLLAKTQPGNVEPMVLWVRKGGGYEYDFTVFDRYLETALKYHPVEQLKAIVLYVWGYECGYPRDKRHREDLEYREKHTRGPMVTVLDPKTGKKSELRLPDYARPEAEKLWRPVLLAVKERLARKGLADRIMLGMSSDPGTLPEHVGMFQRILPGASWFRDSHFNRNAVGSDPKNRRKTMRVGCNSIVWSGWIPDPKTQRRHGWRHDPKHLVLSFNRAGVGSLNLHNFPSPWSFHIAMECTLALGRNGIGRIGADYFRFYGRYRTSTIDNRWPGAQIGGALGIHHGTSDLLGPRPDGPAPTVRLRNLLLGVQEAEARVFIEKALLAKKMPGDLAKKCQDLLDDRTDAIRMWPLHSRAGSAGWGGSTRRLFQYAAEVAAAK